MIYKQCVHNTKFQISAPYVCFTASVNQVFYRCIFITTRMPEFDPIAHSQHILFEITLIPALCMIVGNLLEAACKPLKLQKTTRKPFVSGSNF